ncbi:LCP family protein [Conexibacter woesei]|uniref:Cell envelope-related transcriptional attenuator n=1 Tax=Conexibacter woesei (strain DSM 14684 / CCUG 47730 / CIP 108061 / JCM 11494 / NBRC 100937 / ID131577) TaxID=469383 RepID=D3FBI5_CONWI|nr:LCP family protein [Conexibacter woesei]ADB49354.1 cell envelope-related transcriptional attenuator [Conexibacter woesei DSM 14684]
MAHEDPDSFPASAHARLWLRFVAAAVVVIVLTAGATATAGLLNVQSFVDDLKAGGTISGAEDAITRAEAGSPRTVLLIGSDHRFGADRTDARSDTMLLIRIDPDAAATTVLSIPRDLRVDFRTRDGLVHAGRKINETYTLGGEALTARTITDTFGIEINHIANVNFRGFREAIDAIGCVYVDVDRRYYHSNIGVAPINQYAEIDIMPGYQMMCGQRALDYVRYRHLDNDLVRGARQQEFLRQLRSQYDARDFIDDPHRLTRVIGRRMQTDKGLQSVDALIDFGKLVAFSAGRPIQQIALTPNYTRDTAGASYVEAGPEEIARVRRAFLEPEPAPAPPRRAGGRGGRRGGGRGGRGGGQAAATSGLYEMPQAGKDQAIQLGATRIPVYYPRLLPSADGYMQAVTEGGYPLKYRTRTPAGMKQGYRLVVDVSTAAHPGNYVGIQGLAWTKPPILSNPSSDHRTIGGKKLDLYYDGKRLRLVAWRTPRAVYWVSNTLEKLLTNEQMLAVAGSLTRLGR